MSEPKLCDDWDCPAKISCAHHFVRSRKYNAMAESAGPFFKGDRRQTEPIDQLDPDGPKKPGLRDHTPEPLPDFLRSAKS